MPCDASMGNNALQRRRLDSNAGSVCGLCFVHRLVLAIAVIVQASVDVTTARSYWKEADGSVASAQITITLDCCATALIARFHLYLLKSYWN